MTSLSVLVPVYNEEHLVATSLARLEILDSSPTLSRVQVIVVDDCSTDGTAEVLERFRSSRGLREHGKGGSKLEWLFLRHEQNGGKGKAIRTALARADGEISVIHDADLEYHPKDLLRIVKVFEDEGADAVFGSRFAGGESRRVLFFRHELGNRLLTFLTNLATNLNLTDMETCYKAVKTDLLRSIPIVSNDFRLEPELTIKLAKREARLFEIPISYSGRTYQEGKKINWRDGVRALAAIARFTVSGEIHTRDAQGSHILAGLARAPRFNAWVADAIRPFCGARVLELGSGTGNVTRSLIPRARYVASDVNPLHLRTLENMKGDRPYLEAQFCDVTDLASFPRGGAAFDTVVCLNVLEHVDDDRQALENIRAALAPGGRALVLVPHGERLYGTLDAALGHKRRYSEAALRSVALEAGFTVKDVLRFNRAGTLAWWVNGRLLRRRGFGALQIAALDAATPVLRAIDAALPFSPLSLIAILEAGAGAAPGRVEGVAR
jgi:glycosyltransferase involved in cell wall biosynthesis/phospholipid N-methyltransferase